MDSGEQKQLSLYANLMEEVKGRIASIEYAVNGHTGLASPLVREFCYLQLRLLCELVALSCLVAHGDIASLKAHKIGKAYSADDILGQMTKLRPNFYPEAVKQFSDGPNRWHFEAIKPSPLPKDALLSFYGKTHRHLHRGTLKKMLSMDVPLEMKLDAPEIIQWAQKFQDLLSIHVISIRTGRVMLCKLRDPGNENKVQVVTAVAFSETE